MLPPELSRADVAWRARLQELVIWQAGSPGRWPNRGSSNRREASLGGWLIAQRQSAKTNTKSWTAERKSALDDMCPGWAIESTDRWRIRIKELVDWRAATSKWPSEGSTDATERSLGIWLSTHRQKRDNPQFAEHIALLDSSCPGWAETRMSDSRWKIRMEELLVWSRSHNGRLPPHSLDAEESRLSAWVQAQRKAKRTMSRSWSTERSDLLDTYFPGWDIVAPTWDEMLAQLAEWVARPANLGRRPSSSRSADESERRLSKWIDQQRGASQGRTRSSWSVEREKALTGVLPSWAEPQEEEAWLSMLELAASRCSFHERQTVPPMYSTPDGRKIGKWLSRQRKALAENRLLESRRNALDSSIPGWSQTQKDSWSENLSALVLWRESIKYTKWPSSESPISSEKRLGKWLEHQRRDRRNHEKRWTKERAVALETSCPGWFERRL